MTDDGSLIRYRRAGGRPPPDDERLEIAADGSFEARRTVAGHRVGDFRGQLDAAALKALRTDAHAAGAATDVTVDRPFDAAVETTTTAGRTATMGSNEQPSGPWAALIVRLRGLIDESMDAEAIGGIELAATSRQATLRHIGDEPLDIDRSSIEIRAVRLDPSGAVLGRWHGSVAPPQVEDTIEASAGPDWVAAGPDWSEPLPFGHGLELASGEWLQVWVFASIRAADGPRAVRLFRAVAADGTS